MVADIASKFHQIPEALWERIDLVLPIYNRSCKGGRPRLPMRNVVGGILYVFGPAVSGRRCPAVRLGQRDSRLFSRVGRLGVFEELWELALDRIRRAERASTGSGKAWTGR